MVRSWNGYSSSGRALVRPSGGPIQFGRVFHFQRLVRSLVVVILDELIELGLLLQEVLAGRVWWLLYFSVRCMTTR
jgi:hypothetical protein